MDPGGNMPVRTVTCPPTHRTLPSLRPVERGAALAALDGTIDDAVAAAVPAGPVALVNFPNHRNAGDPAIWLGAERVLGRLGRRIRYRASWASYDPVALTRAVPEGPILLNGGGNLGDAYVGPRSQQGTRERVLADFPGRPVVQLPQSTWFRDPAAAEAMAARLDEHGATTLLLRDRDSLAFAREAFAATPAVLCPDLALALGPRRRPADARVDVLWLARRDPEAAVDAPDGAAGVEIVDWLEPLADEPAPSWWLRRVLAVNDRLTQRSAAEPADARRWGRLLAATFDPLARHWVDRGCRILSRGRVVVTDRLHGHVLALLMGIPSVVLPNGNGKTRAFVDAWTGTIDGVTLADDAEHALALAHEHLGAGGGAP
jgi:pyruvyl transferase EpsO